MSVPPPTRDPALVLEHAPYVRALAQALVFDQHLARDLEQDVLLAALENAPRAWVDGARVELALP